MFGLDYPNITEYEREARTPFLEVMKNKLVRARVIMSYMLIDEYLNNEICRYYFFANRTLPGKERISFHWTARHYSWMICIEYRISFWAAFAKSQDELSLLAKEALTEFKQGKTKLIDEDRDFSHTERLRKAFQGLQGIGG